MTDYEKTNDPVGIYRRVWSTRAIILSIALTAFGSSIIGLGIFLLIR